MRTLKIIMFVLTVIGALNWGLVGLFKFDLVASLFGEMSCITRIVYAIVGLAGFYSLVAIGHMFREHDDY